MEHKLGVHFVNELNKLPCLILKKIANFSCTCVLDSLFYSIYEIVSNYIYQHSIEKQNDKKKK